VDKAKLSSLLSEGDQKVIFISKWNADDADFK